MTSKFRGKYLSVIPTGVCHLKFDGTGQHYTWRRVTSTVHNIIVGKLWIDHHGETAVRNHGTGDVCLLKFAPYSYFSKEPPRRVTGIVTDRTGRAKFALQGRWDSHMDMLRILSTKGNQCDPISLVDEGMDGSGKPVLETEPPITLWKKGPLLPNADTFYNFTRLAVELNEPEPGVCPTDSRFRPDQRLLEQCQVDEANAEKMRLEEKQRQKRRMRENCDDQGDENVGEPEPLWFNKVSDECTGSVIHVYSGNYWECKEKQDWPKNLPDIF